MENMLRDEVFCKRFGGGDDKGKATPHPEFVSVLVWSNNYSLLQCGKALMSLTCH